MVEGLIATNVRLDTRYQKHGKTTWRRYSARILEARFISTTPHLLPYRDKKVLCTCPGYLIGKCMLIACKARMTSHSVLCTNPKSSTSNKYRTTNQDDPFLPNPTVPRYPVPAHENQINHGSNHGPTTPTPLQVPFLFQPRDQSVLLSLKYYTIL